MNQCAVYINKLDEYRKNVNRKIKTGQVDDLYKSSSRPFEKELEGLYTNFDKAFLKLYPNFVEEFNSLLKPEDYYKLDKDQLNTELRIFALMRMGITDVSQIAVFLHYSVQTIYNYKSKVKRMSLLDSIWFTKTLKWLFVNALNINVLSRRDVQKRLLYSLLPIRSRLFSSLYLHHKIFDN